MAKKKKATKEYIYNEEQLKFITHALCDGKLLGIPGGGKTRAIIAKIVDHFEKGDFKSNTDYLIVTFSKRVRKDFLRKGKQYKINNKKLFTTKNIRTLHSITGTVMHSIKNRNSGSLETIVISTSDAIKDLSYETLRNIECLRNLKVIFVDEAQDLNASMYQFIKLLQQKLNCHAILIGDPNQSIYQFQGGSDTFLLNHEGKAFYLKKNYRSTKEIIAFSNFFKPWPNLTPEIESATDKTGQKPVVFIGTMEEIQNDIVREIKNFEGKREEVCIIGPVKKSRPSEDGFYVNLGLSAVVSKLKSKNIKFVKHYNDSGEYDIMDGDDLQLKDGYVNLITAHSSKGLEFKKVIVLNFHLNVFGRKPSMDEYNIFKYLMYVALTRAEEQLKMYVLVDTNKGKRVQRIPFPMLHECPVDLYTVENGNLKLDEPLKFEEKKPLECYGATDLISKMKDKDYFRMEKILKYEIVEESLYKIKKSKKIDALFKNDRLEALIGLFIENILEYFYKKSIDGTLTLAERIKKQIEKIIIIPIEYKQTFNLLMSKLGMKFSAVITLADFANHKDSYDYREKKFYQWLTDKTNGDPYAEFYPILENNIIYQNRQEIIQICDIIMGTEKQYPEEEVIHNIFRLALYIYQKETEMAYMWDLDYKDIIEALRDYIVNIKDFIINQNKLLSFQMQFKHPNLSLFGMYDILTEDGTIIDIKFTSGFSDKFALQLFIYYDIMSPSWTKEKKLEVWNLKQGKKYKINILEVNKYDYLKFVCDVTGLKMYHNIFVYDLETTGLEIQSCEVIERYFYEYNLNFSPSEGLIKPRFAIPGEIEKLTKITNKMVAQEGQSIKIFKQEMEDLFKYCSKPIFIAHNGTTFDHKILEYQDILDKKKYQYEKLDSKLFIRMFSPEDTLKVTLSETYKMIINQEIKNAHRASADVHMVIDIMKELNITTKKIMAMANYPTEHLSNNFTEPMDQILRKLNKRQYVDKVKIIVNNNKLLTKRLNNTQKEYQEIYKTIKHRLKKQKKILMVQQKLDTFMDFD